MSSFTDKTMQKNKCQGWNKVKKTIQTHIKIKIRLCFFLNICLMIRGVWGGCTCVSVYVFVHMITGAHGCQKRTLAPLELEIKAAVSTLPWVLGTKSYYPT